jgi:hypothetical protein
MVAIAVGRSLNLMPPIAILLNRMKYTLQADEQPILFHKAYRRRPPPTVTRTLAKRITKFTNKAFTFFVLLAILVLLVVHAVSFCQGLQVQWIRFYPDRSIHPTDTTCPGAKTCNIGGQL